MSGTITTAFWGMTINNYDEKDLALVRNGYPDYCREIVHTLEEGKEGKTPHIQAWIKLQRQQRISFVKKLFPGAHFKALTSAEYTHNTKLYCQKDDETTQSAHVHVFHDPTGTVESAIKAIMLKIVVEDKHVEPFRWKDVLWLRGKFERSAVEQDYKMAKLFISAVYKGMWKEFGPEMYACIQRTHTHTHTQPQENVAEVYIPTIDEDACTHGSGDSTEQDGEEQGEDYTDSFGSEDEADAESECFESGEEDDGA